jgi:hypothetical protein
MKKYLYPILITLLFIDKAAVAQNITVSYGNTPLHTALKDIVKKTGMGYIIDANCLDQSKTVTYKADNVPVKEVLNKICAENAIKYRIIGKMIFLAPDNKLVHGRVIDQNNEPIEGVTVRAGTLATFTNSRGEFNFRPAACDRILRFYHSGDSTTFRLGRDHNITVRMRTPIATHIN